MTKSAGEQPLAGRVVVVTGASRGLGAGCARRFADLGAAVGVCARSDFQPPPSEAPSIAAVVDVADPTAVEDFTTRIVDGLGAIDLWINNAGVLGPVVELRDIPPVAAQTVVAVNLLGVVYGTNTFVRHRRAVGGGGVLVNITSGAARAPSAGLGLYCATKVAVEMLTDVVNLEEHTSGLRAYAVEPGAVDTEMQAELRAAPPERFPDAAVLRQLEAAGMLTSSEHVADHITALAFGAEFERPGRSIVPPEH
jgi:NAD(P)-dependent dehydrogenase (short-subunit alcohol dehydrogenase family)